MIKVSDILEYLETIAPFKYQENYDNAGLIIGSSDMEVKGGYMDIVCSKKTMV